MCADVIPSVSEESVFELGKSGFLGCRPQNDDLRQIVLSKIELYRAGLLTVWQQISML